MTQPAATHSLSAEAQHVLDEVAEQFARYGEVKQGLCAEADIRHTKHGKLSPTIAPQRRTYRLAEGEDENLDLLPLLTDDRYERTELDSSSEERLRIRVVRRGPAAEPNEPTGGMLLFMRQPAQLVEASFNLARSPGLAGWFISQIETHVRYGYVGGVPLPQRVNLRMRSRGIGSFRFDNETVIEIHYRPCA